MPTGSMLGSPMVYDLSFQAFIISVLCIRKLRHGRLRVSLI